MRRAKIVLASFFFVCAMTTPAAPPGHPPTLKPQHHHQPPKHVKHANTQIWEKMYGFIVPELKKGVIIGEWGGNCKGACVVVFCIYKLGRCLCVSSPSINPSIPSHQPNEPLPSPTQKTCN